MISATSVLRNRGFRNLFLGQAISQLGDSFYNLIFMFMVMHLTKNPVLTGLVAACEWLPFLALGPYAGVIADRMDRRRILLLSDIVSTCILAVFGVVTWASGAPPLWMLFATPACLSSVRVFFMPAKGAAIPRLVESQDLMAANGISMTAQNMIPLLSLPLSATVLAALFQLSPQVFLLSAVGINAVSFLASAWFIAQLPPIPPEDREPQHPLRDIQEGFRYIRSRHVLVVLVVVTFFLNLFISPFYVIYLATNEAWFGGKPQTIAWFEFSFFIGMALGSVACAKARITRPGVANSLALAIVGVTVAFMAFSPNFWLFCLWNVAAGLALPFASIPMTTFMQLTTQDSMRGRVNSALNMVSAGVHPVGMAMSGVMIKQVGLVASYLVMGIGMAAVALAALLDRPMRTAAMPPTAKPESVPGQSKDMEAFASESSQPEAQSVESQT